VVLGTGTKLMRRREFIKAIASSAVSWPLAARAQQPAMPVVGFLHVASRGAFGHVVEGFRRGLAESDVLEGRNVAVEYRWAENQRDCLPALAADLVHRGASVIAAGGGSAQAAKSAAPTTPIVFLTVEDPVKLGWVESWNRPSGQMTGIYQFASDLEGKRLGLLRDAVPSAKTIAVLLHANHLTAGTQLRDVEEAAARLALHLVVARANSESDFDAAFATFIQQQAAALLICGSPFFNDRRHQLAALAARHKLPAMFEVPEFARAGGLMSYGNSIVDIYRQVGVYAGRIVKGAKPADLPVTQPTKFEFVINLQTAKALGLTIPDNLLTLADEVID
jgi:putative tryptophan/tyrosine transport system substrate-binding protein